MTNSLDILKETELRVRFTEAFRTIGAREVLNPEVLQRRLRLCLYGLGTNAGLKRMCSGEARQLPRLAVYPATLHYGKGGEFASNKLENQELLMLSLHLLQVSLVYVNTLMIQQVLTEPEWQGRLTAVDLRALSPLKWQHVNPYGTFTLDMHQRLPLEQVAFPSSAALPKFRASLP